MSKKLKIQKEKNLKKKGYKCIVGLDESGRGPLAGPVVASAVRLNSKFELKGFEGLRDSKKLSPRQRESFYKALTTNPGVEWATSKVSEKTIDKINVLEATKKAMKKALSKIKTSPKFDCLILDGQVRLNLDVFQKSVIKADEKILSCMAAGIIAKVSRDKIMQKLHKKHPQYGFDKHKGYGTKKHLSMIKKYGASQVHRKSFKPVCKHVKALKK